MTTADELEAAIEAAQAAVTKQGDQVRSLKANVKDGKATKVWGVWAGIVSVQAWCVHPASIGVDCMQRDSACESKTPHAVGVTRGKTPHRAALAQDEVDTAINMLKTLKLELEKKQKVKGMGMLMVGHHAGGCGGAREITHQPIIHFRSMSS